MENSEQVQCFITTRNASIFPWNGICLSCTSDLRNADILKFQRNPNKRWWVLNGSWYWKQPSGGQICFRLCNARTKAACNSLKPPSFWAKHPWAVMFTKPPAGLPFFSLHPEHAWQHHCAHIATSKASFGPIKKMPQGFLPIQVHPVILCNFFHYPGVSLRGL